MIKNLMDPEVKDDLKESIRRIIRAAKAGEVEKGEVLRDRFHHNPCERLEQLRNEDLDAKRKP